MMPFWFEFPVKTCSLLHKCKIIVSLVTICISYSTTIIVPFGKNLPNKCLNVRVLEVEITFVVKQFKGEVHVACKRMQQML